MEDLMSRLFDFYFPDGLLKIIVEATNAKGAEHVVRVGTKLRRATAHDRVVDRKLSDVSAGGHVRYRDPSLVADPLTVDEVRLFLGMRIVMGGYKRDRVDDFWSTTEAGDRLPLIADAMRLNRFKSIMSHLSFLRPGYDGNADDKLFKMREVNDMLMAACRQGWDVEPEVVPDESRLRMSSRYCSFTTTMWACPPPHPPTHLTPPTSSTLTRTVCRRPPAEFGCLPSQELQANKERPHDLLLLFQPHQVPLRL